jgi:hypothetical protein
MSAIELSYGIKSQSDQELDILNILCFLWLLYKREFEYGLRRNKIVRMN